MKLFISHSAKTPVSALLSLLKEENAEIRGSFELASGQDISESIRSEIHSSDAVIVVLDSEASNVAFELGISFALRKPTLVLLRPGDSVPPFAAFTPYLTYTGSVTEILKLGVQGFLGTIRPHKTTTKSQERHKPKETVGLSNRLPTLTEAIERLRDEPRGQELQALVRNIFLSAGLTSVQENHDNRDIGVDFVVWSDSLRGSFGNPVLFEVKGHLDRPKFQASYERLTKQVNESKSGVGVLLYLKRPGQTFERPEQWNPLVLWFDLEEFCLQLLHRSLAEVLVERRNLMVHGMSF
jgi:hypothetical protein